MAGVVLDSISKSFGDVDAVRELTLEIGDGEFFSLLGPSGCGKTTTLRLVAGFEEPTSGRVFLGDRDVTQVPAHKRPVNTVFQSYALFPHLNVAENVAFGLRFRNVDKRDREPKVATALELVESGQLLLRCGDDQLPVPARLDPPLLAEGVQLPGALDAEPRLQGAGFVVDPGVDNPARLAGLAARDLGLTLEHHQAEVRVPAE